MADSLREFVADELWFAVAVLTLPVVALVSLAGLESLSTGVAILGWFALTPLLLFWGDEFAAFLFETPGQANSATEQPQDAANDPLEELKAQYARGEIDDREFERKVERLIALDDVDASEADLDALGGDEPSGVPDQDSEPETELERER